LSIGAVRPGVLPAGATAYAVQNIDGHAQLVVVLPPQVRLIDAGGRVHTVAAWVNAHDQFQLKNGADEWSLRFRPAPIFAAAQQLGVTHCDHCRTRLEPNAAVVLCPHPCGLVSCKQLCASAGQCIECGAPLEERWL
jgi:hypothetical protein